MTFVVTINEFVPDGIGLGCFGYFHLTDEIFDRRLSWENIEKAAMSEFSSLLSNMLHAIREKKHD